MGHFDDLVKKLGALEPEKGEERSRSAIRALRGPRPTNPYGPDPFSHLTDDELAGRMLSGELPIFYKVGTRSMTPQEKKLARLS